VAANKRLRTALEQAVRVPVYCPPSELCTDNAAMIAIRAFYEGTPQAEPLLVQPSLSM